MRTVVEEPLFEDQLAAVLLDPVYADRMLDGVKYALAAHAERFPEVQGTPFRVIHTRPRPYVPALAIYFRIEKETVHLIALRKV